MDSSWRDNVELIANGYCDKLCAKVEALRKNATIYPEQDKLLNAIDSLPFNDVKVVILGQDPYHGAGQAHGLSFSVQSGVALPPSLRNIFKEIKDDIYASTEEEEVFTLCAEPEDDISSMDTDLTRWEEQGVLLLNATLSVEESKPGSHADLGWQKLTDQIIESLSEKRESIVFILWGGDARKKSKQIDHEKHLVLEGAHPSPLSAYRGFFGCKHFSQTNSYLEKHGQPPITW